MSWLSTERALDATTVILIQFKKISKYQVFMIKYYPKEANIGDGLFYVKIFKTEASSLEYPKHYVIDISSKGKQIKAMFNGQMLKSIQICEPLLVPEGLVMCE